ncbi:group II intron reverse transcriptase/maturase [Chitinibacter bivalviorum]|uniref:RNA-directed DNA polymerase n=1 Tax=Chitinibacter bivalviorum TaxID=2739434 RepID=A0A7H9BF04_9NEIS|nr:group II intron reverse transcriptase/maturase [Chitinibacter bivalviorum]QLG87199.1 group II intron reverse transcriptase/maturase [Chitinibacter bivalviorum]
MSHGRVMHQKPESSGRNTNGQGEAKPKVLRDETRLARQESNSSGQDLLQQVLARDNLIQAWQRVKANQGSAGVDGLNIDSTKVYLQTHWPQIRERILRGSYRPLPVRRVQIPKPDGGQRELGIPTVTDRLIQQALLQILQPLIDPTFSEHSYGFRPGRRAHDAVRQAQAYVQAGRRIVVDVDLAQFFDRVNHDILMDRLAKRIKDAALLRLIRRYLQAGILDGGIKLERHEGTPQGGPLSPLLANIMLDEVDRELEKRGLCFVRYADDCNVYVRSYRAGQRVLAGLRRLYAKLHLQVNESKTAVASVFGRKFLGFSLWVGRGGVVNRKVADKALEKYKQRIRQLTRRNGGRSLEEVIEKLRMYIPGWKGYFQLAQTPKVFRELDEWLRHRLRAVQLKQWKRGKTIYREMRRLGSIESEALKVAANSGRWWHNSCMALNRVLPISHFDRLGLPRLA